MNLCTDATMKSETNSTTVARVLKSGKHFSSATLDQQHFEGILVCEFIKEFFFFNLFMSLGEKNQKRVGNTTKVCLLGC